MFDLLSFLLGIAATIALEVIAVSLFVLWAQRQPVVMTERDSEGRIYYPVPRR